MVLVANLEEVEATKKLDTSIELVDKAIIDFRMQ